MNKKTITAGKPGGQNSNMNELLKQLGGNELLTEAGKRFPVDLHPKVHREVGELQLRITTKEGKKVTNRMLINEALIDLFKKYEMASEGKDVTIDYVFNPDDTFKSSL